MHILAVTAVEVVLLFTGFYAVGTDFSNISLCNLFYFNYAKLK